MGKTIQETIRSFIVENFLFGENTEFSDGESLLEKGIIDSTGVLELVAYVEQTYGIKVEDEELVPENLDSISNVTEYILRKQAK